MESPFALRVSDEPPRRYDPPHVLWYFGAIAAALSATATVASVSSSHRGVWQLLVGILLMAAFAGAAVFLLRAGWRVPGGVLVAATVALVPAVGQAFERLVGAWPDVIAASTGTVQDFQGAYFALGLATILAGLAAFALVGFPFVFATVTVASLLTAQFLVPAFVDHPSPDDRATAALLAGAVLLFVGLVLDSVGRAADGFWWHAIGLLGIAIGLAWYAIFRHDDWAWVAILVIAAVLLLASAPFHRATWATWGVIGVFGAILHYDEEQVGSWRSPALMILVSVGLILLGIALQLYGRTWAQRFSRASSRPQTAAETEEEPPPPPPEP